MVIGPGKEILVRRPEAQLCNGKGRLIAETHFILTVDLKFTIWQIEIQEKNREYTGFTVPGRPVYQFHHMPFGLCNVAQQCRLIYNTLYMITIPVTLRPNVFVYLDNLLIMVNYTVTEKESLAAKLAIP